VLNAFGAMGYRKIQTVMDEGEVYRGNAKRLIYLKLDVKLYRAGVKTTMDKGENFFLTLFETTEERLKKQAVRKLERIR
jgi:hypothetical protein